MPALIQPLPEGPLDLIGDVHGELDALTSLLERLGVDVRAGTAERPLVFVGDLVDRGPDSPGVVALVRRLVQAGVAHVVLGNHELNLLLGKAREGNGWARDDAADSYPIRHGDGPPEHRPFPSAMASADQVAGILDFFRQLPLALVREDLRVVHACWHPASLERLPGSADVVELHRRFDRDLHRDLEARGIPRAAAAERASFADLRRLDVRPDRPLPAHTTEAEARQTGHPVRALTSGIEVPIPAEEVFFVGGKWRTVKRHDWWNHYHEVPAVVVGHYWRRRDDSHIEGKPDTWQTAHWTDWTGPRGNVFCLDYSVGRRFLERFRGRSEGFDGALAALRWPERVLVFDDRAGVEPTTGWGG